MRSIENIVKEIAQASNVDSGRVVNALSIMMRNTDYVWIDQHNMPDVLKSYKYYSQSESDDRNLQQAWNKATEFGLCLKKQDGAVLSTMRNTLLRSLLNTSELEPFFSALKDSGIGAVPKHIVPEESVLQFVEIFHANDDFFTRTLSADYVVEARKTMRLAYGAINTVKVK